MLQIIVKLKCLKELKLSLLQANPSFSLKVQETLSKL